MDVEKLMSYQNMMQKALKKENFTDRKIEMLTIINQLTFGPKNLVQKEEILIEASSQGFSLREAEEMIQQLIRENIIYESSPGFIKKR